MNIALPLLLLLSLLLTGKLDAQQLEGMYREDNAASETDARLAHMRMDSIIELTIETKTRDAYTFQCLTGSSLKQLEDSLFMFRGDSSWQFTSIDLQSRMEENPDLYYAYMYDEEPVDDDSQRWMDSCNFHNLFAGQGLLDAKIGTPTYAPVYFRPFVAQVFDTFHIISPDAGRTSSYHFADIEPIWWCENLPIPVPDVEQVNLTLAVPNPVNYAPITLPLQKGWKHSLGFGIVDPRVKGNNRLGLYLKVLPDGRLQLSYQYPKEGNAYSIMAVFDEIEDE